MKRRYASFTTCYQQDKASANLSGMKKVSEIASPNSRTNSLVKEDLEKFLVKIRTIYLVLLYDAVRYLILVLQVFNKRQLGCMKFFADCESHPPL